MCDCVPEPTAQEAERMDRYFAGEDVEGFPKHDRSPFVGPIEDKYKAPQIKREASA